MCINDELHLVCLRARHVIFIDQYTESIIIKENVINFKFKNNKRVRFDITDMNDNGAVVSYIVRH